MAADNTFEFVATSIMNRNGFHPEPKALGIHEHLLNVHIDLGPDRKGKHSSTKEGSRS